ncbi:MAG: hypothetical protein CO098_17610 [Bacteroidetes bacterium CG_4_9_14_3_um_filter_41_19]|nr:MAG: hypothetical protein CO098_17610 [Bacteroidetes bacterium CG_4_9_14_3_um_filter_41_19]
MSICQQYGGETKWDNFIEALEQLPSEVKVIGITDYYFIDGYKKVMSYKAKGRLGNIEKIFPILEFRIDTFGSGSENTLQKINLHILFDIDEANLQQEIQLIKDEFIKQIHISSVEKHSTKVLTIENLTKQGGNDLKNGFSNLIPPTKEVFKLLESPTWRDKTFLFLGYKEWSNLEKNQQLKPLKEDLYKRVDAFFTSNLVTWGKSRNWLNEYGNKPLLYSGDIHDFTFLDTVTKSESGEYLPPENYKCNTWIKADPTFEGLKQIIYESDDRVFIGTKPEVLERVQNNKTKYIKSLKINPKPGYTEDKGVWFKNVELLLNKELVAIIGNKGSGKSAISDILGLLCNTHNGGENNKNLTFLNNTSHKKRFRQKGFAENFVAQIEWEDGKKYENKLDDEINTSESERAKYLPQNYFESLTNDLDGEGFDRTLKSVIFLHIPDENRLGKTTFEELERYKSLSINKDLVQLNEDIETISSKIIELETKNRKEYKQKVESQLLEKQRELDEHLKNKPKEIPDPSKDENKVGNEEKQRKIKKIGDLNEEIDKINIELSSLRTQKNEATYELEDLKQILDDKKRFETTIKDYKTDNLSRFKKYDLDINELIKLEFNTTKIVELIQKKTVNIEEIEKKLKTPEQISKEFEIHQEDPKILEQVKSKSIVIRKIDITNQILSIKNELTKPEKEYQEFKEKIRKWEKKNTRIKGLEITPSSTPGTLEFYKAEKLFIETKLVNEIEEKRQQRIAKAITILQKRKEIIELYKEFKNSIDQEINKDKEFKDKFKMEIDVSFKLNKNFSKNFFNYINQGKRGTFYGVADGEKYLKNIFEEKNLQEEEDVTNILTDIIVFLEKDQRLGLKDNEREREILDQIDQVEEFYKFIFSLGYLEPNYELKLDKKSLEELSPGEKGALLLVFYLVIDKEDTPLIIDQPEDNLDNKSVFEVLTHFIRFAKKRRQIIIVTHNPNLAVGADAEQIIHVNIDKKNQHIFSYDTGSIENTNINKKIVDILEGTMPAFDKRKLKYFRR